MKTVKTIMILSLLAGSAGQVSAASAGADPFNFLFLDSSARAVALGGAYTALAADANALHYNPAGLGKIERAQVMFMHNQYFQGITQEYLGYASPKGWGAALNYLDFGGAQNTTVSNPSGTGLGEVNLTDLAAGIGYGRELARGFLVGAGLKVIKEYIAGESAQNMSVDLGMMFSPTEMKGLTFGVALQNLGSSVKFQGKAENMSFNLRAGAAFGFGIKGLPSSITVDFSKGGNEDLIGGAGAEIVVAKKFPVRLGYNGRSDDGAGFAAGLGYIHDNFNFDYAFAPFKELGPTHRFSVTFLWGKSARPSAFKPAVAVVSVQHMVKPDKAAVPGRTVLKPSPAAQK